MVRFVFLIFNASLAIQYSVLASASIEYMGFIQSYSLRDYTYPVDGFFPRYEYKKEGVKNLPTKNNVVVEG